MRSALLGCALLVMLNTALAHKKRPTLPVPTQFAMGRRTYFDFGPPFNFYEILLVREQSDGASVERITLTPDTDACVLPAKKETAAAKLSEAVATLLQPNPCAIPEKTLRHELKRRKKGNVFSGADVTMQVRCGQEERLLRSAILDRDMFDSQARTPEYTSWTMRLMAQLDRALGSGVMDKPVFTLPKREDDQAPTERPESVFERQISAGAYDRLFEGAPNKPSDLYNAARNRPAKVPVAALQSSFPLWPETFVPPQYPPLAVMARVTGTVSFTVDVDHEGVPSNINLVSGSAIFSGAVESAVIQWRFPKTGVAWQVRASITFGWNCPAEIN